MHLTLTKKSSKGIIFAIIGCILGLILITIIILIIYKIKANRIKITFIENVKTKISISKEKTIEDLIDIYYKKRGRQKDKNNKPKIFLYNTENLNTEKYKSQKIEDFFGKVSKKQNADNSMINYTIAGLKIHDTETGIFQEINDEINNNQNRKSPVNEIIVMNEGNILIFFKEIETETNIVQKTEICISTEKKVRDLIELYYKKTQFKKDTQKIFLCDEINLADENYKNNEIKNYIKNSYTKKISVLEKNIIKIGFYEGKDLLFERYISYEKKMRDLIDIYKNYKKEKNEKEEKEGAVLLCNEEDITSDENKDKTIKYYIDKNSNKYFLKISFETFYVKIIFHENKVDTKIIISRNKTMIELVNRYYKKSGTINDGKKIFIRNYETILSEINRNKTIKDFEKYENNQMSVLILEEGDKTIKKLNIRVKGYLLFEIYISNEKKVSDLFDIYYKKSGNKSEKNKTFLCGGDILNNLLEQKIGDINKHSSELDVLVDQIIIKIKSDYYFYIYF